MKKIIILTIVSLAWLTLSGCANDQYSIERQYWKLQKLAEKIFKNPDATPARQLEITVSKFQNFSKRYEKNNLAIDAEFTISRLYIVKKEYLKGRQVLASLIEKYKKNENICAEAMFLIGNSYEIQDKWASALAEYKKIIQIHPVTIRGLDVPVYIAQHYKVNYQPDKMLEAYHEAIAHYKALSGKFPNSVLALKADTLVSRIYGEIKDWQGAINSLDSIIEKYKDKVRADGFLLEKALIYSKQLKDNLKAKEALQALIKEYPDSRLIKAAKKMLADLGGK